MTTASSAQNPLDPALKAWAGGDFETALDALMAAVRTGDQPAPRALFDLAGEMGLDETSGRDVRALLESAFSEPESPVPLSVLAVSGIGRPADWHEALSRRLEDEAQGDRRASLDLALLALGAGLDAPAEARLERLAASGSGEAIAALLRVGMEKGAVSEIAAARAPALERMGHPLGAMLAHGVRELPVRPALQAPEALLDADRLARALEFEPGRERLCDSPQIFAVADMLPGALCDYLAAASVPFLAPAEIFDPALGRTRPDPYRRSLTAALPSSALDLVMMFVKTRLAGLAGAPVMRGESLGLLVYRPGEEYRPHFDSLTEDSGRASSDLARRGQRSHTVLLKLADAHQGGATHFPRLDLSWNGAIGEALVFANIDETGARDTRTLHAGQPVESGTKILASLWVRER